MAVVMIGVDPHKASHTAVAISAAVRGRPGHRRRGHRRRPPRVPLPGPGSLRRLQRHRPHRGVLWRPESLPAVEARQPPAQPCDPHGRGHPDPLPAHQGPRTATTRNWPKAKPRKKRCARSSARSATPSSPACRKTPGAPLRRRAREGNRGTTVQPGRPAHTPTAGSSGKPLPGLPPSQRPPLFPLPRSCHPVRATGRVQDRAAARPRSGARRAPSTRPRASR
jgi:hypothetical protein